MLVLSAVLGQYTLMCSVISDIRVYADAAGLAERIAGPQPLARVVARHGRTAREACLVSVRHYYI